MRLIARDTSKAKVSGHLPEVVIASAIREERPAGRLEDVPLVRERLRPRRCRCDEVDSCQHAYRPTGKC
jgi:hypothetical protein